MEDLNAILEKKLREKSSLKVQTLAERRVPLPPSNLASGIKFAKLSEKESADLEELLHKNSKTGQDIGGDLEQLKTITEEVKSIHAQAIVLHGERIKRAQILLKQYREGAFSEWLLQTYGNRQTPYNFLQYYDFYQSLTIVLREKLLDLPKQAVYTLASRPGEIEKKTPFIEQYQGETKEELLANIRKAFPLKASDKRKENPAATICTTLHKLLDQLKQRKWRPNQQEKERIKELLTTISFYIEK